MCVCVCFSVLGVWVWVGHDCQVTTHPLKSMEALKEPPCIQVCNLDESIPGPTNTSPKNLQARTSLARCSWARVDGTAPTHFGLGVLPSKKGVPSNSTLVQRGLWLARGVATEEC